jgi:hypothetical protein
VAKKSHETKKKLDNTWKITASYIDLIEEKCKKRITAETVKLNGSGLQL